MLANLSLRPRLRRCAGGIDGLGSLHAELDRSAELHTPGPYHRWDPDDAYSPSGGVGRVSTRVGTFVPSTFAFDPVAFGLSTNEAALMDPQQRVLLEETVNAFGDAGHAMGALVGSSTGVYVGCIWLEYGELLAAACVPAGAYMVTGGY